MTNTLNYLAIITSLAGGLADESKQLETSRIETNIIENFKQIHTYYRRIASIIYNPKKLTRMKEK